MNQLARGRSWPRTRNPTHPAAPAPATATSSCSWSRHNGRWGDPGGGPYSTLRTSSHHRACNSAPDDRIASSR